MPSEDLKVAVVGYSGAGKTVFLAGLYATCGFAITTNDRDTEKYVKGIRQCLDKGEWPQGNLKGTIDHLRFNCLYKEKNINFCIKDYSGELIHEPGFLTNIVGDANAVIFLSNTGLIEDKECQTKQKTMLSIIKRLPEECPNVKAVALAITAADRLDSSLADRKEQIVQMRKELEDCLTNCNLNSETVEITVTGKLENQNTPKLSPKNIDKLLDSLLARYNVIIEKEQDKQKKNERGKKIKNFLYWLGGIFLALVLVTGILYIIDSNRIGDFETKITVIKERRKTSSSDWEKSKTDFENADASKESPMIFYKEKFRLLCASCREYIENSHYHWIDKLAQTANNTDGFKSVIETAKDFKPETSQGKALKKTLDNYFAHHIYPAYANALEKFIVNPQSKHDDDTKLFDSIKEWNEYKTYLADKGTSKEAGIEMAIEHHFEKKISRCQSEKLSDLISAMQQHYVSKHIPQTIIPSLGQEITEKIKKLIKDELDKFDQIGDSNSIGKNERKAIEDWWDKLNKALNKFKQLKVSTDSIEQEMKSHLNEKQQKFAEKIIASERRNLQNQSDIIGRIDLWKKWHESNRDIDSNKLFSDLVTQFDDEQLRAIAKELSNSSKFYDFDKLENICNKFLACGFIEKRKLQLYDFCKKFILWKNNFYVSIKAEVHVYNDKELAWYDYNIKHGKKGREIQIMEAHFKCDGKEYHLSNSEAELNDIYKTYSLPDRLRGVKGCQFYIRVKQYLRINDEGRVTLNYHPAKEGIKCSKFNGRICKGTNLSVLFKTTSPTFSFDTPDDYYTFPVWYKEFFKKFFPLEILSTIDTANTKE